MKSCIDFYDDSANDWADEWYENEHMLPYLKEFLSFVNKPKARVLDLCCGSGYESRRLCNLGADVVGVDLSENSLNIAREKNLNISFYKKDMLNSYADLGEFDGIVCIAGIIHIEKKDIEIAFKNMAEVLKSGGYLLLVFKSGSVDKQTTELNGETYARNSINYTKDELKKASEKWFSFVKDLSPADSGWKYFIYKRR